MAKIKRVSTKIILEFYKKYLFLYILFITILLLKASISFYSAILTARLITSIINVEIDKVIQASLINFSILSFSCFLSYINTFLYKNIENKVRFDIEQKVVNSILNMKFAYYENIASGEIMTRIISDINSISESFKEISELAVNIIRRIAYIIFIFFLNIYLGVFVLTSIFIISIIYSIRIYFLAKLKPIVKSKREIVNSKIMEIIKAVKDIKTLNCDKSILKLIEKYQKQYIKTDNQEYYVGIALYKLKDFLIALIDFIFILIGCFQLKNGYIFPTIFYTCYLYKEHTYSFAKELGDLRYELAGYKINADRLLIFLEENENIKDVWGKDTIINYDGSIQFENVNFSYNAKKKALKNISFKIGSKKTIAVVGESGSGKTTLINLISHLYYKDSGIIKFKGIEIERLSEKFIRDNITIINQFPYLFNLSIKENFKLINPNITDNEIIELCNEVYLKQYILSLPDGINTVVGEGGCKLSGGQKQRLSIARALCKKTNVLILDESTSSLDNNAQNEIMKIIKKLSEKMTIIIVTHKVYTVTFADSIILLRNGIIEDVNTHENLLKNNEYYRQLFFNKI